MTRAQLSAYIVAQRTCLANGIPQSQFWHRHVDASISPVAGNPAALNVTDARPRTANNPTDGPVMVWAVYKPFRVKNTDAGDTKAMRVWRERGEVQLPVLTDDASTINMQDEDFLMLASGFKARILNPCVDPSNSFWTAEYERYR